MSGENLGRVEAGFLFCASLGGACAELAEDRAAPLANYLFRDLVNCSKNASDGTGCVVRNGTVGDCEMRLFGKIRPVKLKFDILDPGGRSAVKRRVYERFENIPDFRPALPHRAAQPPWMLPSQDWTVRIVVNRNVFRSPPEKHGKAVGEKNADHGPQGCRPSVRGVNGRRGPVKGADERSHFAAARKKIRRAVQRRGFRLHQRELFSGRHAFSPSKVESAGRTGKANCRAPMD